MKIQRAFRLISYTTLLFVFVFAIGACSPALYKRPAEDFQAASIVLQDTYFLEWELSNKAIIERGDLEDQIQIWGASVETVPAEQLNKMSTRMAERRGKDIHEKLRPLRVQAFKVLDGYASVLVSLSSDDPTTQIQSELGSLIKDIEGTLEAMDKLNMAGETIVTLKKFTGPLQQYVGVLSEIIGVVSNILREQAIVKTIGESNESIVDLLSILGEEAVVVKANALRETKSAIENVEDLMSHTNFLQVSNGTKVIVTKKKAELEYIQQQIKDQDIASVFDAALKAQGALVKKAMLKDPGDWVERIKRFKEQVTATKAAIEKIK